MVKNLLILRFGNEFFGATWNRNHIDSVQISFKEPFGTEGRGGYFDEFGIIRDVMQNHLLQVLTLLAMERPISFSSEDIRDEKVRVLRGINAIEPKNVIIGQYGKSLDGTKPAYKEDDTVPKDSRCPTFCAMVAFIKNERWDGVPFMLKAGKALNEQKTEIRIQFKDVTSGIFKDIPRNELVIRVQPNESVYIKMNSKLPGLSMQTVVTELDLTYRRRFSDLKIPEAYESLILDALKGDHSNFVRDDELDASWRIFSPLLHYLDEKKEIIPMEYPYGKFLFPPPLFSFYGIYPSFFPLFPHPSPKVTRTEWGANALCVCAIKAPVAPPCSTTLRLATATNSVMRRVISGRCRRRRIISCD